VVVVVDEVGDVVSQVTLSNTKVQLVGETLDVFLA